MKYRTLSLILFMVMSSFFYSCVENSNADRATDEMERETENAVANVGAEIREESEDFSMKFKETRTKISTRMEMIESDMEDASAEAKAEMQEEWNKLKSYREDIDGRMERVGDNMDRSWKNFKGDVKKGWNDFSTESRRTLEDIERDLESEDYD